MPFWVGVGGLGVAASVVSVGVVHGFTNAGGRARYGKIAHTTRNRVQNPSFHLSGS